MMGAVLKAAHRRGLRVRKFARSFIGIAMIGAGAAASADTTTIPLQPDTIIAARQAAFALMGGDFGAMKATIAAGGDVKPLSDGAKAMSLWARTIPDLFPPGTEKGHDTQALPAVWSDAAGFRKAAQAFGVEAGKLAQAAESGDKASFAAQFKETGKACGECHRTYRVRPPE